MSSVMQDSEMIEKLILIERAIKNSKLGWVNVFADLQNSESIKFDTISDIHEIEEDDLIKMTDMTIAFALNFHEPELSGLFFFIYNKKMDHGHEHEVFPGWWCAGGLVTDKLLSKFGFEKDHIHALLSKFAQELKPWADSIEERRGRAAQEKWESELDAMGAFSSFHMLAQHLKKAPPESPSKNFLSGFVIGHQSARLA